MRAALATALAVIALVLWIWRDHLPGVGGRLHAPNAPVSQAAGPDASQLPDVAAPPPAEPPPAAAPAPETSRPEPPSPAAVPPPESTGELPTPEPRRAAPAPAAAPRLAARSAPSHLAHRVHLVQPGDSLWSIAQDDLGDGRRAHELYQANRDQIKDPHRIHPGQVLVLPPD